jgi:hypothetical protein
MNRKLKALGLALIAVAAMAFSASAAMAAEFHSEATHTILSGSQVGEDKFKVNAGTVTCGEATYSGTQATATAETQTVTPTYSECKAFGFVNTTIDVNGCTYTFNANNSGITITCSGSPITVTAFNCWVTVGSQTINSGVTYTNEVTKDKVGEELVATENTRDVKVSVNLTGITYTQHSKSFPGCSTNGGNPRSDGTYEGAATVRGFNTEGTQVGVWKE